MELFDIIKHIFEKPKEWCNVSNQDKKRNSFILNRMFSIGHPLQANMLQHKNMVPNNTIDIWQHLFINKFKYNKTPFWIFTKGSAKAKKEKENKLTLSDEIIREYCKKHGYDLKTINDAFIFYKEEIIAEIKNFEKIKNQNK